MMKSRTLRLYVVCIGLLWAATGAAYGQFKRVYVPDSSLLNQPSQFITAKVVLTDLPGREVAVVGSITASDTSNAFRLGVFNLLLDRQGNPVDFHVFEDTSAFVFQSPRAYAACYDGDGQFYLGIGANGKQVVLRTDASGTMHWARSGNHHEYYSMLCEGGTITVLGQDESIQGAHDFSISQIDSVGVSGQGTMFGTTEFELPTRMVRASDGYVMAGSSYQGGGFRALLVKADLGLNQSWAKIWAYGSRGLAMNGLAKMQDGGYMLCGRATLQGADSVIVMRVGGDGSLLWTKLYGFVGVTECHSTTLALDPVTGGCAIGGFYRGASYNRPFVMKIDSMGDVVWAREYADRGLSNDESIVDIVYSGPDSMFYAAGDMVEIDSNQFIQRIFLVKVPASNGGNPCDSSLVVGSASASLQEIGTTVEEPFLANNHFPMGNLYGAAMTVRTRCAVMVGLEEGSAGRRAEFRILNPSSGHLQVWVEVPDGGGWLEVHDVTGHLLHREVLDLGMQHVSTPLDYLPSGIYLVSVSGEGWRYGTQRWVVQD